MKPTVLAFAALMVAVGPCRADACFDLWRSRNQIYKSAGYCFKKGRTMSYFGNAGCQYDVIDDVPLSPGARAAAARYAREEAALGCPR